jgi:hypothetical protein
LLILREPLNRVVSGTRRKPMADWRKLAKEALLADGRIDTREV